MFNQLQKMQSKISEAGPLDNCEAGPSDNCEAGPSNSNEHCEESIATDDNVNVEVILLTILSIFLVNVLRVFCSKC